jgi:hypothetical protein
VFVVTDDSTEVDFGSHTRTDEGLFTVTATVIDATVTSTASDHASDAVKRL